MVSILNSSLIRESFFLHLPPFPFSCQIFNHSAEPPPDSQLSITEILKHRGDKKGKQICKSAGIFCRRALQVLWREQREQLHIKSPRKERRRRNGMETILNKIEIRNTKYPVISINGPSISNIVKYGKITVPNQP